MCPFGPSGFSLLLNVGRLALYGNGYVVKFNGVCGGNIFVLVFQIGDFKCVWLGLFEYFFPCINGAFIIGMEGQQILR